MKSLYLDQMSSIEGGVCVDGYKGTYCPLAFMVLGAAAKSHSFFALFAGLALKKALCISTCSGT